MPRAVEVLLSLAAIVALSPLIVVIAAINWATTGRVIFRQERVGSGLRAFTLFKFQTMVDRPSQGTTVTVSGDTRVTAWGRILRAAKLDELPQLFNVLRGEMSLVGPRALTPNEVARISPDLAGRVYSVRPGLTGLATLALTDEERVLAAAPDPEAHYFDVVLPQKMVWESLYVKCRSVWVDALILAATPLAIAAPAAVRAMITHAFTQPSGMRPVAADGGPK